MRSGALRAAAAAMLLGLGLSACSTGPAPARRTEPDHIEKAAVAQARIGADRDGLDAADDPWIQLWTPTRGGQRIARCVGRGSDDLIRWTPSPLAGSADGLSYTVQLVPKDISIDGGVGPPFFDGSTAQRLVDGCIAQYPIDFRLFSVPKRDRGALYAYDLTVLRRCLLSHGQPVAPMPTRQRFEDLLRASAPWNAYEQVEVTTRSEWYALADACPALPPAIAGDVAAITTSATTP